MGSYSNCSNYFMVTSKHFHGKTHLFMGHKIFTSISWAFHCILPIKNFMGRFMGFSLKIIIEFHSIIVYSCAARLHFGN